ncbi:pre-mRNA-splicing factor CWC25 homolog [Drosophila subpulchrella]|uniref:pre-mRNA-splicing factor CWC25 homolog n=1 Tax=Drosophila subpulchrella TaxID=1486046 RepID=UPI0018A14C2C|nr:pre-mRNA-splicing factor CWC25 homolog [Drosophila subpulchrella]
MGGGDLNLKKSWHPHTMKNQERVWKAEEQAKMEERKLEDLRKEINEERDREELRRLGERSGVLGNSGGAAGEAKLEWMYKNSTELINREEYLLGRKIDKSFETLQAEEHRQEQNTVGLKQSINHVEHDCVPFSIRTYRNLQSTEQVDMQRKTLEDPLMLIKQREMESRRKLLENPVKLKEIHRILKTEQDLKASKEKKAKKSKKSKKSKKKKNKKRSSDEDDSESSDSDDDLDRKLARQVSKLKGDHSNGELKLDKLLDAKYRTISKQLDLATKKKSKKSKRKSSDSSDESSDDDQKPRRQRSREPESRRRDKRSPEESKQRERRRSRSPRDRTKRQSRSPEQRQRRRSPDVRKERRRSRSPQERKERRRSRSPQERKQRQRTKSPEDRKDRRRRPEESKETSKLKDKRRSRSPEERSRSKRSRSRSSKREERRRSPERPPQRRERERSPAPNRPAGKPKLSESDREARLREMMDNATWREADRTQVVRKHREAYAREEAQNRERDFDKEFINKEVKKAIANHNSIGDRIRANLNNIQRTASSMDSNFARK